MLAAYVPDSESVFFTTYWFWKCIFYNVYFQVFHSSLMHSGVKSLWISRIMKLRNWDFDSSKFPLFWVFLHPQGCQVVFLRQMNCSHLWKFWRIRKSKVWQIRKLKVCQIKKFDIHKVNWIVQKWPTIPMYIFKFYIIKCCQAFLAVKLPFKSHCLYAYSYFCGLKHSNPDCFSCQFTKINFWVPMQRYVSLML